MEFSEEDLVQTLKNVGGDVGDDWKARVLKTYRDLRKRNADLNRERARLKRDKRSWEDDIDFWGVNRRAIAGSSVPLDPEIWSKLPLELLLVVFAHLRLVDIIRLRALSMTWNRYVSGDVPGFTQLCAEAKPRLFGMVGESTIDEDGLMSVMVPGPRFSWHKTSYKIPMDGFVDTMRAGDGGLVCFVSPCTSKCDYPRIVVRNPLTCRDRALPRLPSRMRPARLGMVQLVMDRDLECYKVLAVYKRGASKARVFCSIAGKWRKPEASDGLIFGYRHTWQYEEYESEEDFYQDTGCPESRIPCVYDCTRNKLIDLDDESSPWKAPGVWPEDSAKELTYVLVKDRLFVLHKALRTTKSNYTHNHYWISEYQARMRRPCWAKVRDHTCGDVPPVQEYIMGLYACRDFLLVTADHREEELDMAWLYDIPSEKWRGICTVDGSVGVMEVFRVLLGAWSL